MEKKSYITLEEQKKCRKCDYLFNHTSGKVSGGTEGEALRVKKMISWEQRKGGYESADL